MGEQQEKEYPGEMYDEEVYFYPVDEVIVEDCCPASVYKKIPCCEGTIMKYFFYSKLSKIAKVSVAIQDLLHIIILTYAIWS